MKLQTYSRSVERYVELKISQIALEKGRKGGWGGGFESMTKIK